MLEKLYKTSLSVVVSLMLLSFFARGWSTLCTKTAVRLYYGSKSSWDRIYILSDARMNDATVAMITDTSYDVIDEPTSVVYLNPQECAMNRCKPDMLISHDLSFFVGNQINYPIGQFDITTIGYASVGNASVSPDRSIIGLDIWGERVLFAVPKESKHKIFTQMIVKRIVTDELFRRKLEIDERMKQIDKAKKRRGKKTEEMRRKIEEYGRLSKLKKSDDAQVATSVS